MANNFDDIEKLNYDICRYSSYSTSYLPENILEDSPSNQASRWSSNTNNPPQFLTLKLKRPAIVQKITFGKFEKSHVCNLKKFKILGGLDEERLITLFEGGLKNDSIPETFNLRCVTEDGKKLPILYLKIMPLLSWGPSFNFSIWYVELHGQDDLMFMGPTLKNYNMLREIEIVKLCLKHFRQQGYNDAFKALQDQTNIRLEHQIVSHLHSCLVVNGEFKAAENFIEECIKDGLMDEYLKKQDYKHTWKLQETTSFNRPGTRGGHQLVIDTVKRLVYLYGGWDGFQDLSDLWLYDMEKSYWSLVYERSEDFLGPTPRSCHKMIFDPVSENIFMLGRYLDNSIRTTDYIKSDFFLYDTRAKTWLQICDDTSQVGGPQLMYDHQMCIDVKQRMIYVFGGKILTPRNVSHIISNEPEYSGLFSYHIATNTWTQILVDCHHPSASQYDIASIKSRITHCMVFHNKKRKLYIYGGQRGKDDMNDFITYDVDTQSISVLNAENNGCQSKDEPPTGFTLRATIDCNRNEIYVFSSLSKQKGREVTQIDSSNSFWVYSLDKNTWSRIYSCKQFGENCFTQSDRTFSSTEPCPRYAHQLVYDDVERKHYLFGGNPGKPTYPQLRLDDFWILLLEKPKRAEILKHCRYLIRRLYYEEITKVNPLKALKYLQTYIYEVIDHTDAVQLNNFHKLASLLFKTEDDVPTPSKATSLFTYPMEAHGECVKDGELGISDSPQKSEDDVAMSSTTDDSSMQSYESNSSLNGSFSFELYKKCGGKKSRNDYLFDLKSQRTYLFNKLVEFMPSNMVQPKGNLSDFVII